MGDYIRSGQSTLLPPTTPPVIKATVTGRAFPMTGFSAVDVDLFEDVAESLSRICRYDGHVPGNAYSVAQHCVVMADAALRETGNAFLAAHCLLHDAHEAYIGDLTTPTMRWFSEIEHQVFHSSGIVSGVVAIAKKRLDAAIWAAAEIAPPDLETAQLVKSFDLRMLATERRHLLAASSIEWGAEVDKAKPIGMTGMLRAMPIGRAAEAYREWLHVLCPGARRP
jgi:hypothetical protein